MDALQAGVQLNRSHRFLVLASPIIVVIIGHFAARFFLYLFDDWAWLGSSLVYWGSVTLIICLLGDKQSITRWFGKSQGSKW
jgi:hypothetical protein